MRMYDIIAKKRDGKELTAQEISFFIKGYTEGSIPDYQASALLMAIYFRGMTDKETVCLTEEMAKSGDSVDLSRFGDLSVDKHSTGGVGDKTTLIVAPIVAALGAKVTKMSGRGLGHTGGTVDKLESIPNYKTSLSPENFLSQAEDIGIAVIGQSGNLTPADKKLYALRDVTATVDSIPLITSSIMSKKLAAGSKNIVLDVKVGSGAFMKTLADAEKLAENMVWIGKGCGRRVSALLTDMDSPLGTNIGNALEVKEAVSVLKGESCGELYEVCVALASEMISLALCICYDEAEKRVRGALESGAAFEKMIEWVKAQGGDERVLQNPELLPSARYTMQVVSEGSGFVTAMNASEIGVAAMLLGAGRASKEDEIDSGAGIVLLKKVGDRVEKGEVLATLYTSSEQTLKEAQQRFLLSVNIGAEKPVAKPLIYKIIR
ncbi:MAG: pyrimidine-nucleoside phosphorylase [Oscillospiraceae bacterium]|nr:pyrimidine-nucleoside phosphorylase [Oscillospiraceae bacterium]